MGEEALKPDGRPVAADADAVDAALAAAGDAGAFERLYHRHAGRIFSLSVRMMGMDEAEEMTQEIFVRTWEKLGSFQGKAAFGTWLFRLGVNTILTRRASNGRRREREVAADEFLENLPARPMGNDSRMDFERGIRTLPDGAREILVLHDVEGFKHEEIADMLDISVGTSKSQLHRARMMLRGVLRR